MTMHVCPSLFGNPGEGEGATFPAERVSGREQSCFFPTAAAGYTVKAGVHTAATDRTALRVGKREQRVVQHTNFVGGKHSLTNIRGKKTVSRRLIRWPLVISNGLLTLPGVKRPSLYFGKHFVRLVFFFDQQPFLLKILAGDTKARPRYRIEPFLRQRIAAVSTLAVLTLINPF